MHVLTIRVPQALYERIKARAKERGQTITGYVVGILWKE